MNPLGVALLFVTATTTRRAPRALVALAGVKGFLNMEITELPRNP